jgi:hypothetical protein
MLFIVYIYISCVGLYFLVITLFFCLNLGCCRLSSSPDFLFETLRFVASIMTRQDCCDIRKSFELLYCR